MLHEILFNHFRRWRSELGDRTREVDDANVLVIITTIIDTK
ncbi:hypothetical protein [Gordonia sp. DT101]